MLRPTFAALASSAVLFSAATASAQTATPPAPSPAPAIESTRSSLGEQGQLIFGAERIFSLFGFQSFKTTASQNTTVSDSSSVSSISLLGFNPTGPIGSNAGGIGVPVFYTVPRIGADYVVIPNLTVGGSLTLVLPLGAGHTHTESANGQSSETSTDGAKTTIFGIAPRVGYVIALSELFAIWPRGGFSFYTARLTFAPGTPGGPNQPAPQDAYTITQWAFDAEGLFVFTPFPHVGITAGLALDVPLTGSFTHDQTVGTKTDSTSADASMWHVGVNAGLLLYF